MLCDCNGSNDILSTATFRQASPSASYVEAQSQAKRYESEAFDQANSQVLAALAIPSSFLKYFLR